MTDEVRAVADAIRSALPRQEEWQMQNSVPGPYRGPAPAQSPASYRDFLAIANGLICGPLVVFDAATVPKMQFYADTAEGAPVKLRADEWFCAGTVNDEPWFLHRADESVWTFPDTGVAWWMSDRFEHAAPSLERFLLDIAWGPGYPTLTGATNDDQWWELLQEIGRV
jgi:hypothetical protein